MNATAMEQKVADGLQFDGKCADCGRQKVLVITGNSHWGSTAAEEEMCMCMMRGEQTSGQISPTEAPQMVTEVSGDPESLEELENRQATLENELDFLLD
eukprot:NODE_3712_length_740_cov_91.441389_g1592_i1.p1 GENE.NODE_3712_length_740_cov_91.441389_g1592_i1~~NODE_3712_length_740_cov_91.441389_g1592_i1.p1  ORF type:complete len:99 (-),score=20.84 NODE_3712_length_740_cov_91.441389_g1592_i1:64-360(-)